MTFEVDRKPRAVTCKPRFILTGSGFGTILSCTFFDAFPIKFSAITTPVANCFVKNFVPKLNYIENRTIKQESDQS